MNPLNRYPLPRRSAVTLSSTLISRPSRRWASISKRLPRIALSPLLRKPARPRWYSARYLSGTIRSPRGRPIASSRDQPKIVSACGFQSELAGVIHLDEGIERGIDDAARQLLAFEQRLLRQPALGHVAADEEITPDRLRPCAHPRQHHDPPVLVDVARIGTSRRAARAVPGAFPRGCCRGRRDG